MINSHNCSGDADGGCTCRAPVGGYSRRGCGGLLAPHGERRGRYLCPPQAASCGTDRPDPAGPWWSLRRSEGRRRNCRAPERRCGGRGRGRPPERHVGAPPRAARGPAHPLPDRHQSRRRHRRRRDHLRRRHQRRSSDRGPVRAGRDLALTQRPQPSERKARRRFRRHRPAPGQEYQRSGRNVPGGARRRCACGADICAASPAPALGPGGSSSVASGTTGRPTQR